MKFLRSSLERVGLAAALLTAVCSASPGLAQTAPAAAPPARQSIPGDGTPSPGWRSVSLDGAWTLRYGPLGSMEDLKGGEPRPPSNFETVPATVPGNVELDLQAAGRISDPEIGARVYELLKFETYQWWYSRSFRSPQLAPGEKAELVFDGLDCFGTVWVNGRLAGRGDNMFIPFRFDVTRLLRPDGDNEVMVRIDPAVVVGNQAHSLPGEYTIPGHWEQMNVRKAQHMFGWNITPRIVSAGLWKGVRVDISRPTHFKTLAWATATANPAAGTASLMCDWEFATDRLDLLTRPLTLRLTVERDGRTAFRQEYKSFSTHGQEERSITLEHVEFWWPRGYGAQPLYEATATLLDENGNVLDENRTRIGIRTVKLRRADRIPPSEPGDMAFIVNGKRLFLKGFNFGAIDSLHSRDAARVDRVFAALLGLNGNLIRLYGVSAYPPERLYDLCDENGILIWQEFSLGNTRFPQTEAFRSAMRREADGIVTRFRNHPSLALWVGGNEFDGDYVSRDHLDPNVYDSISRHVLPLAVELLDPHRDYMPCGYTIDEEAYREGGAPRDWVPEAHLYLKAPPYYFKSPFFTSSMAHFVAEIGWKGCPQRASLAQMLSPEALAHPWTGDDNYHWNEEWLVKAPQCIPGIPDGPELINILNDQAKTVFTELPHDLDGFIAASQSAQAEAEKFFVDTFRMRKGNVWGVVLFQLNDSWPLVNYGMIDYYFRPKLSYRVVQQCMRDVQAICGEAEDGRHALVVVNDTFRPVRGRLTVTRAGETAPLFESDYEVPANGRSDVGSVLDPSHSELWKLEWTVRGEDQPEGPGGGGTLRYEGHYLATHSTVHLQDYLRWMKAIGIRIPEGS